MPKHERESISGARQAVKLFRSAIFLLLLLFVAGCGPRKIEGVITDQDGHPIEKAEIGLLNAEGTELASGQAFSISDQNGHYMVSAARGKTYSISVAAIGFPGVWRKIEARTPNPVNFLLHGHAFKVGDRVRLLYPGWCPGTITAIGTPREEGMYSVKFDDQSHNSFGAETVWQKVVPLGDPPADPEPCSLFKTPPRQ
jgi:hypothetical protein